MMLGFFIFPFYSIDFSLEAIRSLRACLWKFNLQGIKSEKWGGKLWRRCRLAILRTCLQPVCIRWTPSLEGALGRGSCQAREMATSSDGRRRKRKAINTEEVETVWYSVRIRIAPSDRRKSATEEPEKVKTFKHVNSLFLEFNSIANNFHVELNIIFKYKFPFEVFSHLFFSFFEPCREESPYQVRARTQPIKLLIWHECGII